MKCFTRLTMTPVVPSFFYLIFSEPADVYLGQGTGSAVSQVIVGVLVAGLFAAKPLWNTIKTLCKKRFSKGEKGEKAED